MAQTEKIVTEGITELGKLWGGGAATCIKSIVCLNLAVPCAVAAADTKLDPADAATLHTDSGLELVNIATVTPIAAGVDYDHVFTATASKNVAGIMVLNDDDDCCYIECCFNAVIAMENTDTLTIDGTVVIADA